MSAVFSDCTGVILCGGNSKRMGKDKATLTFGERTMLEIMRDRLSGIFDVILAVTSRGKKYPISGMEYISDAEGKSGPLAGIHSALLHAATKEIFVAAVDMPFLDTDTITKVAGTEAACGAVLARRGNIPQPLCAKYHRSLIPEIENLYQWCDTLQDGRHPSMKSLIDSIHPVFVDFDDSASEGHADPFLNMNTEADYRFALSIYLQRGG